MFKFSQQGQAGTWMSELLPHIGSVADELCVIRSLHTDAHQSRPGHHAAAARSSQIAGRPGGNWLLGQLRTGFGKLGLASLRRGSAPAARAKADQPLYDRLWGSGFTCRTEGIRA